MKRNIFPSNLQLACKAYFYRYSSRQSVKYADFEKYQPDLQITPSYQKQKQGLFIQDLNQCPSLITTFHLQYCISDTT